MKGKWVYVVNFIKPKQVKVSFFKRLLERLILISGTNSVYENEKMALRKVKRMRIDCDRIGSGLRVIHRKVMYFTDEVEEGSFEDRCSICGALLEKKEVKSQASLV